MKIEIKFIFDDSDHDDIMALNRILKSEDLAIALFEIANNLWRDCETIEEYKEKIFQELGYNNINLEELIQ